MLATLFLTTMLTAGADAPADLPAVHTVPGPYFRIPCKMEQIADAECAQVYVSENRGETWKLWTELTAEKPDFTYRAKKAGEYWFAVRLKKKDGTLEPANETDLVPQQRVEVKTGCEPTTKFDTLNELDDELTRMEFELIRKELKQLAEEKILSPTVQARFDVLRNRLRAIREKMELEQKSSSGPSSGGGLPPVLAAPSLRIAPKLIGEPTDTIKPPVPPLPTKARDAK
jgi:hypothetical protein